MRINIIFYFNMNKQISEILDNCEICAACKLRTGPRYGYLPLKNIEQDTYPWQHIYVDSISPWTVTDYLGKPHTLHAIIIIDPSIGWFECFKTKDKPTIEETSEIFDINWFCRYP